MLMWVPIVEIALLATLAAGMWFAVLQGRFRRDRSEDILDRMGHIISAFLERTQEALTTISRRQLSDGEHQAVRAEVYRGYPLDEMIRRAEIRNDVHLTWAARQLLILPIIEGLEQGEDVGFSQMSESIDVIVATAKHEPSSDDQQDSSRGAKSVIKAFHRRFCNIPPFCSRREEERSQ